MPSRPENFDKHSIDQYESQQAVEYQHDIEERQSDDMAPDSPSLEPRQRRRVLPIVLFLLTCCSTFFAGACGWHPETHIIHILNFDDAMPLRRQLFSNWDNGLLYMVCVLGFLFTHEMGHFIAAVVHRIPASYPYFIPLPITFMGTMGAVIGMDGMRADRKQIFDIGIAGPIAGLFVAIPLFWFGAMQLDLEPNNDQIRIDIPILGQWMLGWVRPEVFRNNVQLSLSNMNPYFAAGWVGMFVSGLNMLPVGQLDGGHVTYTLFGRFAHRIARIFMAFVIALMIYDMLMGWGLYSRYFLMVILVTFIGIKHPPTRDDSVKLGWFRTALGLASLSIPILCFPPKIIY